MAAVFVTGNDLLARADRRDIAELAVDTDSPVDDVAISTSPNVIVALEDAEGEVIANLQAGGRYSVAQLSALEGTSLSFLKRMICELAMRHLYRRRPSWKPELLDAYEKLTAMYLKRLSKGDAIFGGDDDIQDRQEAGRPSTDGPTLTDISQLNFITDRSGYFRKRVLPNGRNI
jgi:hypothetical protein